MTASEIMKLEQENTNSIILLREGIFWKAYEKSAYAFYNQIHAYKITHKYVQIVQQEMVSIGFPIAATGTVIKNINILHRDEQKLILAAQPIDEQAFLHWKQLVTAPHKPDVETRQTDENTVSVVDNIRYFNIESKTPLECMNFIAELKQMLTKESKEVKRG